VRDPKAENWLKTEGVKYRYEPALPLDRFDLKRSRDNQARPTDWKLPEDIERYALAMIDGDEFPCVVVSEGPEGFVLIDGNQRWCAAYELDRPAIDAFVVEETDRLVLLRLTMTANGILNGVGLTAAEVLKQAVAFKMQHPTVPMKDIAKSFRMKVERIELAVRQNEVTSRLGQVGVSVVGLSSTVLRMLHGLEADPVLQEVARLTQEAGLAPRQVQELVSEVRRQRSERAQMAVVARWRKEPEIAAAIHRRRRGLTKRVQTRQKTLFDLLGRLIRFVERNPTPESLELTAPEHLARLQDEAKRLVGLLNGVLDQGNRQMEGVA
jgi:ParB-like chromosome segregation protein Spo0J